MTALFLFRGAASGLGLDLGTSSVKVVELARVKEETVLVTYAFARQPNLLVESGSPDAIGRLAVLIREMFQRAGVSKAPVAAALPILSVFSTVIELPDMPEREMESAVTFAAKNYVPSPLQDVVLGWTAVGKPHETGPAAGAPATRPGRPLASLPVLGTSAPGAAAAPPTGTAGLPPKAPKPATRKMQEVFLTAAPRDLVSRYTDLVNRLGVRLAGLEVESFPLARSLLRGEARPALLVDLGDRTTSFSIVDDGYLRLNQAMDLGGNALTTALAAKLSIGVEEAEKRKQTEGMSGGDASPLTKAMQPVLTELVQRGEALRRLYERKKNRPFGKVVLIGGGARLSGLTAFWSRLTGLTVEVGNPWRGIQIPSALSETLRQLGPSFAVAVGLALRPFEKES